MKPRLKVWCGQQSPDYQHPLSSHSECLLPFRDCDALILPGLNHIRPKLWKAQGGLVLKIVPHQHPVDTINHNCSDAKFLLFVLQEYYWLSLRSNIFSFAFFPPSSVLQMAIIIICVKSQPGLHLFWNLWSNSICRSKYSKRWKDFEWVFRKMPCKQIGHEENDTQKKQSAFKKSYLLPCTCTLTSSLDQQECM